MSMSQKEIGKKRRKLAFRVGWIPIASGTILTVIFLVALLAPLIATHSPIDMNLADRLKPPAFMAGGEPSYLLGTDSFGRDIFSRIAFGARISLMVAALAVLVAGSIGTIIGMISGYFGGWVDIVLMRVTDIGLSLPLILMAIVLVAAMGPSLWNVILVITVLLWPRYARQIRGETLSVKECEYVAAARVAGCSHTRIILRHVFPNITPTLLVLATLQVGYIIILESTLSFLGAGIPEPQPAWGVMVGDGRDYLTNAWWIALFPGLAILLTVLSANLLGDWIRDRLDPKLRQV